ncbi:MAG: DNA methylase [Erysipelotrichaceae bacterium]|nr:DNA methylase [Erysipelotrichaceae bacterium]
MEKSERTYLCIDLKSFYASVECVMRKLDPLDTNLVVADESRTDKTICLAVSPSLKLYGISARPRLYEVKQKVREVNDKRRRKSFVGKLVGSSYSYNSLQQNSTLAVDFIVAEPRMQMYLDYSASIYKIYLNYISAEDIHVYSIDEVFIDLTNYLKTYDKTPHEIAMMMIRDVLKQTGITATAGIGTNMYLAKVAMDIVAKKMPADDDGVRIAELDEMEYRRQLWDHQPLTDFWRIGRGYTRRLAKHGLYTMGDVARCSEENEDILYKEFGINAELLIDHAWGYEPCLMSDIKKYTPENHSLSSGQVLSEPYPYDKAKIIIKEMADNLVLSLVDKKLVTDQIVIAIAYDVSNIADGYEGDVSIDYYGRPAPKGSHGSINLGSFTSSTTVIMKATEKLFDAIIDKKLTVRKLTIVANNVKTFEKVVEDKSYEQLDLFTDPEQLVKQEEKNREQLEKERKVQETLVNIKMKYGKNAVLKGMNLQKGATARDRNRQIGGHKS